MEDVNYNMEEIISIVPAILLALTHVSLHAIELKIHKKDGWHWLSLLSGIAASYVFLVLIPDLETYKILLNSTTTIDTDIDSKFYAILMLFGFTFFYSLESWVKHHRSRKTAAADTSTLNDYSVTVTQLLPCESVKIFMVHILAYSIYDFVITFLLPNKLKTFGEADMWFYYFAMQAHFVLDDMNLHEHFGKRYDNYGRIPLLCAVVAGFTTSYLIETVPAITAGIAAFIAGGTIVNILKEELPAESRASVPLFLVGMITYGLLIYFLYYKK